MDLLGKYRVLDGGLATELVLQHHLTVTVMNNILFCTYTFCVTRCLRPNRLSKIIYTKVSVEDMCFDSSFLYFSFTALLNNNNNNYY